MRIAVNTRLLLADRLEGIGRFTEEVLKRLVKRMPDCEFTFLFDRPHDPRFIYADNVTAKSLFPQARHPLLYRIWFDRSIPFFLRSNPHDLFLSTDGFMPLRGRTPSVNVIHDINFEHFDDILDDAHDRFYKKYMPRFAHHATRLLTVSDFSRYDISSTYNVPEENIDVIYNGVSDSFHPSPPARQEEVRKEVSNGAPYFIYVGSLNARKNISFLLRSFDRFCAQTDTKIKLVIVGSENRMGEEIKQTHRRMTNAGRVVFTGRVDDTRLVELLGSALAMTFVPLFEGFGIPLIEAFACELPVITTNVSSLPEVAEDAALYVDPYSEEELVSAMSRVLTDASLRSIMVKEGLLQAKKFSWDKSAEKLEGILRSVIDGQA